MLSPYRVLDLTDETGSLAGKILGDLGADVIKVEPPGGDLAARRAPYLHGVADPERSLAWLAHNTSKRGVTIDLDAAAGQALFQRLVASADVVIESFPAGAMAARGLGHEALRRDHPGLVWCAITPFGSTGPRAGFRGGDLVVVAMGGNGVQTGDPDRPPVRCTLPTSQHHGAPEAVIGILMALFAREETGRGRFVDVSLQECQVATLLGGPGQYVLSGHLPRRSGARTGRTREIWPAKDGHVTFGLRGGPARAASLAALVELMDECGMAPAWLRELDFARFDHNRLSDAEIARLEEAFGAFFRSQTLRELYEEALRRRILLAPCNDSREVFEQPQLRDRGFLVRVGYPELGVVLEHPGGFARSDSQPIEIVRRAPRIGEHDREILGALGAAPRVPGGGAPARAAEGSAGIFSGLRILEFGSGAAGPVATRYFVEQGATVVRVESARRPDFLRTLQLSKQGAHGLDAAPMFVLLNPGKRSVTLDLAKPEGAALARRLVAWADVVCENFAPGVMARFGLDPGQLRRERPELVVVSSCLFGQTGPERSYPGFGGQGSAIAGYAHLTGWPDREGHGPYGTITDSLSPRYVALLIAAALLERRRTGEGQTLDLSQIEVGVYSLSEMVLRYAANQEVMGRRGNRAEGAAPHGVYPCSGEDRWIAIAVGSDDEWRALVRVMGEPTWAREPDLASAAGRLAREADLDTRLAAFTRGFEPGALMQELQAAGVPAGAVQTVADLLADPQLAHRGHFRWLRHLHLGELPFEHTGFRIEGSPPVLSRPGPNLGEHNAEVLGGILGLPAAEIERLVAQEVVA